MNQSKDIQDDRKDKKNKESKKNESIEQQIINNVSEEKKSKITNLPKNDKTIIKALYEGERGDTYLLIRCLKDRYVYDNSYGQWYYWNDHYWRKDELNHICTMIDEVIDSYGDQQSYEKTAQQVAVSSGNDDESEDHLKKSKKLQKRIDELRTLKRAETIVKRSRMGKDSLCITGNQWDKKPMVVGCRNGCVHLDAEKEKDLFQSGNPKDYICTISPTVWNGIDEKRDLFEKFIFEMYSGDDEVIKFIQRLLGYGICGLVTEHIFPVFYGQNGRNGKSTLFEILKYVVGSLAYKAPSNFLMDAKFKNQSSGPDSVTMGMRGKRYIWFSETNENERFDIAKLKEFVGGDTISARPPYGKTQIEFNLNALMMILLNRRPKVPAGDDALWRRLILINHKNSFIDNPDPKKPWEFKADKFLFEKLKKQSSGILAWIVEGFFAYQEYGLMIPQQIIQSTQEYRRNEDIFGHFVEEQCVVGNDFRESPKKLYERYKKWCLDVGHKPMAKNRVYNDLKQRFGERKKVEGFYYFYGLVLIDEMDCSNV